MKINDNKLESIILEETVAAINEIETKTSGKLLGQFFDFLGIGVEKISSLESLKKRLKADAGPRSKLVLRALEGDPDLKVLYNEDMLELFKMLRDSPFDYHKQLLDQLRTKRMQFKRGILKKLKLQNLVDQEDDKEILSIFRQVRDAVDEQALLGELPESALEGVNDFLGAFGEDLRIAMGSRKALERRIIDLSLEGDALDLMMAEAELFEAAARATSPVVQNILYTMAAMAGTGVAYSMLYRPGEDGKGSVDIKSKKTLDFKTSVKDLPTTSGPTKIPVFVSTKEKPEVKDKKPQPAKPEQQAQRVGGIAPKDGESKIDFVRRAGFTTGTNEEAIDAFNKVYPDYGEEDAEAGIPLPQRSLREGFDKEDLDEPLLKTPVTPEIEDDAPEYKDPVPVVGLEDEGFTVEVAEGPFAPIYRKNGRKVSKNLVDIAYKKLYLAPLPALEDEGYTRLMMPAGQKERYFDPDGQEVSEEEIARLIATAAEDKEAIRQATLSSYERGKKQDLEDREAITQAVLRSYERGKKKGLRQVATTLDDVAKGEVMLPGQMGDGIKAMQTMIAGIFADTGREDILPKYGADGKYGRETRNAVTVLQRDVLGFTGKDIDGKYGPKTHKALKAYKEASAKLPISVSPEIEGPPSLVNESILNRWKKIIKG
jgi:peptidoglycan hydrolase-like protein with peptidoglycan-binding domain